MSTPSLTALVLTAGLLGAAAAAEPALRVEPPHWWIGFKDTQLQLMVEAEGVAASRVQVQGAAARLLRTQTSDSPHHLWLDLDIDPNAPAGELLLRFERDGRPPLEQRYALRARAPGSADRQGFGPRDAIYLLVPDRFAKASDSSSRGAAGLLEAENRAEPGGRHGGDLAGMTARLPYIAGLGFTQLWPTPLLLNDSARYSYHGYAATDFFRIDPRFGSHADYLRLAQRGRELGVGLIQDIVLNHIGVNHRWMQRLPAKDWVNQWPQYTETHHARVALQDPHAAESDRERFASGWFSRGMPDLNQRNPLLATFLTQMSLWWVEEAGLSGIRTDTYSYSDRAFLSAWSARLMKEYPRLNIVGEEWSPHPAIVSYWQRGKKNHDGYQSHAPSLMDFPLQGALLAALNEADGHDSGFTKLHEALAHDFLYPAPEQLVLFGGNHDTPRLFTALQRDLARWKMAVAYMVTVSRIPQWFYGDELLLESPAQRDDGRVRADFPGGWKGDSVDGFSGQGLSPQQKEAQGYVRALFQLRKAEPLLHTGQLMHYAPHYTHGQPGGHYALFRYAAAKPDAPRLMLLLNKSAQDTVIDLGRYPEMAEGFTPTAELLEGRQLRLQGRELTVPARSASLFWLERR